MGFASKKAFISLKMANIYKFKIPKPSKFALAQTIEGPIRYFEFINKAVLKLIQCFLQCKYNTTFNIKNITICFLSVY